MESRILKSANRLAARFVLGMVAAVLMVPAWGVSDQLVQSFALNGYKRVLDGQWQGIRYASDGNVYFGSSTHSAHHGAAFFKYNSLSNQVTLLADDITTICGEDPQTNPQGKLHSDIVEANGWLYMSTHFSSELPGAYASWSGSHVIGYELATGTFRDYGVVHANYTSYSGVGVDPARNYLYVFVTGQSANQVSYLYRINTLTGVKTNLGQVGGRFNSSLWMFVDRRGDVWFSVKDQNGDLRRVRADTGQIDLFPNALPPLYRWDSEQVVPGAAEQAGRWILWMQPLDGDRALFTLGQFGGMLYQFDSSKPIGSGQEFQNIKHIGYSDLGMALGGNRVFYYQRANRGFGHQDFQDFHLLSVSLDSASGYPITDHGLIKDQNGRLVWRAPGMMTDGQSRVFIIGDWWTIPGDLGTLRYNYNGGNEIYVQLPRGEFFAVANVAVPPANSPPSITITSPTGGTIFTAPASINFNANATDTDGAVTRVDFYANGNPVGTDTTSPFGLIWSNVAAGTYNLTTKATDNAGASTTSTPITITVQSSGGPLPPPWQKTDIGSVGVAGNASYSSGVFTVNGSGSDIWASLDSFHFVYQALSGDGQMIARVASQQNTNAWAKAGVMIRNTLTSTSANAAMLVTPGNGLTFQRRITSSGNSTSTQFGSVAAPYWVKISRTGTTFTGSRSTDGTNWTVVGSATITMGTNVYIGLAVTSHNNTVLSAAVFDNVSVSGNPPGNNPPSVNIISPTSGSTFTAPASFNISANASDTDGTITQVEFFSGSTSLGIDPSSPYSVPYNNVPAGTYNLTAKATDNLGGFTISNPVTVTVQPPGGSLPPPWVSQDIGAVGVAGSSSHSSGAFTIHGAGSDIWNTADSFHYVYQPLSGDGQMIARVASQQNTNPWAKAGVMIRGTLTPGSIYAAMLVTPSNGLTFQRRTTTSATSASTKVGFGAAPYWVKISRSGNTFTGSRSTDGINWTIVGSATITMGTNAYVGLAVTSHNSTVLGSAILDNITATP